MTILITGSKGFIGSNAIRYFQENGDSVIGCDKLDSTEESYKYYKIAYFEDDIREIIKTQPIDVCLFASGAADVRKSFIDTGNDFTLNVNNLQLLLEAVRQFNSKIKIINTSSAAVYGNPDLLPVHEGCKLSPVSPYGHHKLMSEKLCTEYTSIYGIPTVNMRIFSVYGPGQNKMLFYDLYKKSRVFDLIDLFGTGNESRDFIYIEDLLDAVSLLIKNASFKGESINVANGEEILIKNAVEMFYEILNPEIKYRFTKEVKQGDPLNWRADISMLKSFGYNPKISLHKGLTNYCNWLNEIF